VRIETPRAKDEPFNYAAKMNRLWRAAEGEQIVFLNDDCLPITPGWLRALISFSTDQSVGGVGARLRYDDGRLQHAGLAPHGPAAAHLWLFREKVEGTYQDWALVQREWSMVTGAVFATRRSVLEQADGFEERFSLEFNDTDLCMRLRSLGYRIVCTPMAEMIHSEKASRGEQLPPGEDIALFLSRWRQFLDNDPSWHPNLQRDSLEMRPAIQNDWFW
jgi:GT2 family glycosyltransferase